MFKDDEKDEIRKVIRKIKTLIKRQESFALVGGVSTGKSTVINEIQKANTKTPINHTRCCNNAREIIDKLKFKESHIHCFIIVGGDKEVKDIKKACNISIVKMPSRRGLERWSIILDVINEGKKCLKN